MLADMRVVDQHFDAGRLQQRAGPNPGELQNLRRQHRTGRDDDFVGAIRNALAVNAASNTGGALAVKSHAINVDTCNHSEICALPRGLEKSIRRADTATVLDGVAIVAHAFLL